MKIYLEYVFIENLIVNYIIINQVGIFTKTTSKNFHKIISSIILSVYTIMEQIYIDSIISNIIIKLLLINISIYIAFLPKKINIYFKQIIYFYLISFTYVGIIISITLLLNISIEKTYIKIFIYLISNVLLYIFNKFMWKVWKTDIKENDLTYKLNINGHEIQAFIDTGNNVKDYVQGLDVVFINNYWYKVFLKENLIIGEEKIFIDTINSTQEKRGYILKNVLLKKKENIYYFDKMMFIFTDNKIRNDLDCDAIIGYDTYIEKLKGASL